MSPVFAVPIKTTFSLLSHVMPALGARLAEELFLRPMRRNRKLVPVLAPQPSAVEYLDLAGQRIAVYRWAGASDAPRVLFAHGWAGWGLQFDALIAALTAQGYEVATFDQPGHGASTGDHSSLPAFAHILKSVAAHVGHLHAVIGHSLGGAAAAVAIREGMQAERLVLVGALAEPVEATRRFARMLGFTEKVRRLMQARIERREGMSFAFASVASTAERATRPTLVIHDLGDKDVPWGDAERYALLYPDARLLSTSGLGHHRILKSPLVSAAVIRFLQDKNVGTRVIGSRDPALQFGESTW
jgi:pimeloyl-ACP methyl ester carboxylesterase